MEEYFPLTREATPSRLEIVYTNSSFLSTQSRFKTDSDRKKNPETKNRVAHQNQNEKMP